MARAPDLEQVALGVPEGGPVVPRIAFDFADRLDAALDQRGARRLNVFEDDAERVDLLLRFEPR
jgi:hypothetical protein